MTTSEPRFEWDPQKAASNAAKHGVRFAEALQVFWDPNAVVKGDPDPTEERYLTIGMGGLARVLVVVFTWRRGLVRIISARKATRWEERQYHEGEK
ncbi:MAG TPA: BrnT family toxin [Longimicrobium sp.]|nr:BrnT family toxin [Longimicrobium sp.]